MAYLLVGTCLGLMIFLTGLRTMTQGLRSLSGAKLRWALERFTSNPVAGLCTGALLTALIQSSSGIMAVTVGLVDAGLLDLEQALGVILGANIGTTLTAQLLSMHWESLAPAAICFGTIMYILGKSRGWGQIGVVIAGAGGLLWGIDLLSMALRPLTYVPVVTRLILQWEKNHYFGILAGTILTVALQSSGATIGLVLALAGEGLVGLPGGMAIVLGSNIGTVMTTLIASIGTEREARQTAVADLLFNILGVLVVLPFFQFVSALLRAGSQDVVHQIANGHTLFNVLTAMVALPMIPCLAALVRRLIPR